MTGPSESKQGSSSDQAPTPRSRRRRLVTAWVGTAEHFEWLKLIVKLVIVLNVIDAILTVIWIATGQAIEANPLLQDLAHGNPLQFVIVKLLLVSFGTWLLWRQRKRPLAVIAIFAAFLVYYFLIIYHLQSMNLRLIQRFFG